jgi:MoaA/NifB/PqqE/SkfB family radical SAM enzyme
MFVMLSKNSFVRSYGDYGHIINQLTNLDRLYNKSGKIFLEQITRKPRNVKEIVDSLYGQFKGVEKERIEADLMEFIGELESEYYLVTAEDEKLIAGNDISFSYDFKGVKTAKRIYRDLNDNFSSTESFFYENINKNNYSLKHIYLELTRKCNERCVHCYIPNHDKDRGRNMALNEAKSYISQAAAMNVLSLTLSGGEPFLNKNITEILYIARENDMMFSVLSNLTLVTENHIKVLKETNPSQIQVSLYSLNPETHDLITKLPGSFDKTFKTINRFIEEDIPVQISCPVMKHNYRDFKDVLDWAYKHRIKANTDIDMNARYDGNKQNLENAPTDEMVRKLLEDVLQNDGDWRRDIEANYAKGVRTNRNLDDNACGAGIDTLYISSTGKVLPCSSWESYCVGNLTRESLKELWKNSHSLKKLRDLKVRNYSDFVNSEYSDFMSLCPARFANHNGGDYLKIPRENIEHARITKEIVDNYVKTLN